MRARPVELLNVALRFGETDRPVGRLASADRRLVFEYDPSFLADPLPLSPFYVKSRPGLHEDPRRVFDGLLGLFHDSLPDSWGRLLLDREADRLGIGRQRLTPLDRLAWVGDRGWGALVYHPAHRLEKAPTILDLAGLAREADELLEGRDRDVLPRMLALGGSSGGARPKIQVALNPQDLRLRSADGTLPDGYVPVIVKLITRRVDEDAGVVELAWHQLAAAAGLELSPAWLLSAGVEHAGFFATARFDRPPGGRLHAHSLSGLIHADHAVPCTDYETLLRVTRLLTRDQRAVERVYRQMVFNVVAHVRDDHSRNFAFLMSPQGEWRPSPAYDLTFSPGPGGEHWMTVAGEGREPGASHLLEVARRVDVPERVARELIEQVREAISGWESVLSGLGVGVATRRRLGEALARTLKATAPGAVTPGAGRGRARARRATRAT